MLTSNLNIYHLLINLVELIAGTTQIRSCSAILDNNWHALEAGHAPDTWSHIMQISIYSSASLSKVNLQRAFFFVGLRESFLTPEEITDGIIRAIICQAICLVIKYGLERLQQWNLEKGLYWGAYWEKKVPVFWKLDEQKWQLCWIFLYIQYI